MWSAFFMELHLKVLCVYQIIIFSMCFFIAVMWCFFAKVCQVEMRGGNGVNSGIPLCLCPCWDLKKVCVTEWFDQTDNWTYPASFTSQCFVLLLVLLGCWLRGNIIRAVLSTPNHIWLPLACRIYQVRGREDTTKTSTYYRTVFPLIIK